MLLLSALLLLALVATFLLAASGRSRGALYALISVPLLLLAAALFFALLAIPCVFEPAAERGRCVYGLGIPLMIGGSMALAWSIGGVAGWLVGALARRLSERGGQPR